MAKNWIGPGLVLVGLGCTGPDAPTDPTGTTTDCETIAERTCGVMATGDTGCPEGFACSGPSVFVCYRGSCDLPECLPPTTQIATPAGPIPIRDLHRGDFVWSLAADGQTVPMPIIRLGSVAVPADHQVVSLDLADGRRITASPGHPDGLGRALGDLAEGSELDGSTVLTTDRHRYTGARTWDLLPAGPTGTYWADGVLLGSTLSP